MQVKTMPRHSPVNVYSIQHLTQLAYIHKKISSIIRYSNPIDERVYLQRCSIFAYSLNYLICLLLLCIYVSRYMVRATRVTRRTNTPDRRKTEQAVLTGEKQTTTCYSISHLEYLNYDISFISPLIYIEEFQRVNKSSSVLGWRANIEGRSGDCAWMDGPSTCRHLLVSSTFLMHYLKPGLFYYIYIKNLRREI